MNSQAIFNELLQRYPVLDCCSDEIYKAYIILKECYENGGKVLACGNGGSAADADHIVGELMKGFLLQRKIAKPAVNCDDEIISRLQGALPAISLNAHSSLITAFSNDLEFDCAYAQQVFGYAAENDALIALSTSGNSKSVVNAVRAAAAAGIRSIGITGSRDSAMSEKCTVCIKLPEVETFKIQELTLPVYHCLCAMLERDFFES